MPAFPTMRRLWVVPLIFLAGALSARGVSLEFHTVSLDFPDSALYTATGSATCLVTDPTVLVGTTAACTTNTGGPVAAGTPINMRDLLGAGASRRVYMSATSSIGFFTPLTVAPGGASEIQACSCDTGAIIATRTVNMICRKALLGVAGGGYDGLRVISKGGPGDPPAGTTCATGNFACCDAVVASDVEMRIQRVGTNPECGFTMRKGPGAGVKGVVFDDDPPCRMASIYQLSNGGNPVQIDFLPDYLLQIDRNGGSGNVTITVDPLAPGSPQSFTVVVDGKSISTISNEVANDFRALTGSGLDDLDVSVDATPVDSLSHRLVLQDPAGSGEPLLRFAAGGIVHIHNAGTLIEKINVQGQDGHLIRQENFNPGVDMPTLSEWAMLVVALLLLASGYWLLRRRRHHATA